MPLEFDAVFQDAVERRPHDPVAAAAHVGRDPRFAALFRDDYESFGPDRIGPSLGRFVRLRVEEVVSPPEDG